MLNSVLPIAFVLVGVGLLAAVVRLVLGPSRADRVVALDLIAVLATRRCRLCGCSGARCTALWGCVPAHARCHQGGHLGRWPDCYRSGDNDARGHSDCAHAAGHRLFAVDRSSSGAPGRTCCLAQWHAIDRRCRWKGGCGRVARWPTGWRCT